MRKALCVGIDSYQSKGVLLWLMYLYHIDGTTMIMKW